MSASIDLEFKMNNNDDANKAAAIMKEIASERTPEYPKEIEKFIAGITVEDNIVKMEDNYSLMSNTFSELIPHIMEEIAKNNFGAITMEAWFTSYSCSYEAECKGRVFKNGNFRLKFSVHE